MTAIHLERAGGRWVDRYRAYHVLVNGRKRAELRRGERCDIDVEPGEVEVHLEIDWCRSRSLVLDLPAGAEASMRCRPRSILTAAPYGITFGRGEYIFLELEEASP